MNAPEGRSAKAAATRAAILASARRAFAQHGYEGAGLRGIAEEAGVTAMMVNRYFGSKEGLFGEVVHDTMRDPVILSPVNLAAADPARAFAEALVGLTGTEATPLDGFLILFRSTTSDTAARIARARIAEAHQRTAEGSVAGEHAAERAALLLSLVAGVQMMRQMMQLAPLAGADPAVLAGLLTPVIGLLLGRVSAPSQG
ncbi:TetR/AcrR family transcriptional regulator [Rhodovarius crocodyli]|uniref:TetR/AcrR family transcriptional regulator n=1 Tax=Rhodovarius crocodyli TaxID=1979269 RepID=A0A437MGS5_9PROT|nr:TetR/AcrR family transcriptional regulator [Rhodovarius crocodyli]RVT96849.1 TetR/AcrR family transcriptional regulator [Rhodovarius crocodyli]